MKKGKGDLKIRYRLSPNEVEQLSKEETARRRKLRLVQVREQSKVNAAKIRNDVKKEKSRQLDKLSCEIKNNLEKEKMEKLRRLEQQYENDLKSIGTAHRAAKSIKDSQVDRLRREQRQKEAASQRFHAAIKTLRKDRALQDYKENKHIISRKAALEMEMLRAAEIASLPPPPPDPVEEALKTKPKAVPMTDMNAFSTTHYHMPDYAVVKAGPSEQTDAREAGEEEDERLRQELKEKKHLDQDRIIRARIRGNEALRKEHLRHEYSNMLQDLSLLQRADWRRRQEEVADLPKQVFLPPDRRVEEKETKQRDMEKAFEDMYLADKHPTVLMSLDTQTPPDTPPSTESDGPAQAGVMSQQLTSTTDGTALRDVTNITTSEQETKLKQNETALMKLFNRIKQQKEDHATRSVVETIQIGDMPKHRQVSRSVVETSQIGDMPKHRQVSSVVQLEQEANGLSPLSEYSALETCSLPSTSNHGPSPTVTAPRQVQVEVCSPKGDNNVVTNETKAGSSPDKQQSEEERQAWQNKILQLEAKQKELDGLINKFKHMTGLTENADLQTQLPVQLSSQHPVERGGLAQTAPPSLSHTACPTQTLMTRGTGGVGSRPSSQPGPNLYSGQSAGQQGPSLVNGPSQSHPSGIYHARPVQITDKAGGGMMESGYYSGLPGSFRGYQAMSSERRDIGVKFPGSGLGARDMATHSLGLSQQADHVKRVREYQERILQSSQRDLSSTGLSVSGHSYMSDADLARKVRDYQTRILAGNADRRQFLEETKANIERQREDLYRKYPLTMGTKFEGFAGPSATSVLGSRLLPPEESLADKILNEIRDPTRPRSLDMSDIRVSPGAGVAGCRDPEKLSTSQMSTSSSKARLERIKRSLLFDDPDESLTRTPGRDISLLAPSDMDEGDMTSSSERGSPNLSKSVRSDGSVGGMSLVTRARETGNVFEKRQLELQKQLEEVQRQKEEILQRYQLGQQKIQDSSQVPRMKLDITGTSYDLSQSVKSNLTDPNLRDISFASLPSEGNIRPMIRRLAGSISPPVDDSKSNIKFQDSNFSLLSEFPKSLEQLSLLDSARNEQDSQALTAQSDEKSSVDLGRIFSAELEEESLSHVSSTKSAPQQTSDRLINGSRSVSMSLEEESLSPESRVSVTGSDLVDRITWSSLLTGVPSVSAEDNGFKTVESRPDEYVGHDLSTIFEVDTPAPTPATRGSGQFVTLTSASSLDTLQ